MDIFLQCNNITDYQMKMKKKTCIVSTTQPNQGKFTQQTEDHHAIVNTRGTEKLWVNVILKFLFFTTIKEMPK
jgi:hypothetical protein